jgi:hypothetical protein
MPIVTVTATIPAAGSITPAATVTGPIIGIIMPPTWTPAVVTVQGSSDGTTFYDLYDGMTARELIFNFKANAIIAIAPTRLVCCKAIKLRSGTGAKPVTQPVACQFGVIVQGP